MSGYRQYELLKVGSLVTIEVCWLPTDDYPKLKEGTRLSLKGRDGIWEVRKSYDTTTPDPPLKKWPVGGLV